MAEPTPQKDENIIIRTMKGDLQKLSGAPVIKEKKPEPNLFVPVFPTYQAPQAPTPPPPPKIEPKPTPPVMPEKPQSLNPPILIVPPKIIPPKEFAEISTKPLFKATPVWLKISGIGLGVMLLVLFGLYGYWKVFIQSQPVAPAPPVKIVVQPTLPVTPTATTTASIKFFNKLPNKEVTIDLPSKTPAVLTNALTSEAAIKEALASVKRINITYQGKPITAEEFFNLMSMFAPQNFLSNYGNDFALAFFSQKEGVRPILILKIKDKNLAESQMANWESKMFTSDIFPLFLSNSKLPKNVSTFKSYLFIGQPVHYLNINLPFASLNYAMYNNFLIFTTSSAGMFVILQDLTGQSVSIDYKNSLEASLGKFVK